MVLEAKVPKSALSSLSVVRCGSAPLAADLQAEDGSRELDRQQGGRQHRDDVRGHDPSHPVPGVAAHRRRRRATPTRWICGRWPMSGPDTSWQTANTETSSVASRMVWKTPLIERSMNTDWS